MTIFDTIQLKLFKLKPHSSFAAASIRYAINNKKKKEDTTKEKSLGSVGSICPYLMLNSWKSITVPVDHILKFQEKNIKRVWIN